MDELLRILLEGNSPEGVTELNLDYRAIREYRQERLGEIAGLNDFVDLEHLNITGHNIDFIPDLSTLTALKSLDLSFNPLRKMAPKPFPPSLKRLFLADTELESVPDCKAIPNLELLNMPYNLSLTDISGIADATRMEELSLAGCKALKSVAEIATLPRLKRVFLAGVRAHDWEQLAQLPALQTLHLQAYKLAQLEAFAHHTHLENLHISGSDFPEEIELPALPALQSLTIRNCGGLKHIAGLQNVPNLTEITFRKTGLAVLPDFSGLPQLAMLDLSQNQLKDIRPLAEIPSLKRVKLEKNPVETTDLEALVASRPDLKID